MDAPGLPNRKQFGDINKIPTGKLINYVVQHHIADKAGPHYDMRFGENDLFSWAVPKGLPQPGEKRLAIQQPLHTGDYANFEGEIEQGYGKGTVKTHDKGSVIVTEAGPSKISFTVTHKKTPENFNLIKTPKNWLLVNSTPQDTQKFFGQKPGKIKMVSVPAKDIEPLLTGEYNVQEKIDGAYQLFKIYKDNIDAISHRTSVSGKPIVHTLRIFGPKGAKPINLPKELEGATVQGETYGERNGKSITPSELGGLLNSSVERSLKDQALGGIKIKNAIFTVNGSSDPSTIDSLLKYLPENFHAPLTARTGEEARKLWDSIQSGKNPRTQEGVIAWPKNESSLGGRIAKVKVLPETDVIIRKVFKGQGKYSNSAGGFEYSHVGSDKIVGKVGTGFSDAERQNMFENPDDYIGRRARVRSMGEHESRALRAPSFLALHEDYTKIAALVMKLGSRRSVYDDALETASDALSYAWDNKHHLRRRKKKQMEKTAFIREEGGQFFVHSEKGKRLSRGYATKAEAAKRLGQIEYFKHAKAG